MAEPSAEDFPAGGIVTTVNGVDGRTQLYDLPNEQRFDPSAGAAYFLRNPGGRDVVVQALVNGFARDNIGRVDERQAVSHAAHEYDSILLMRDLSGAQICTATISTIEGFELRGSGTLISTAAHCLESEGVSRSPEDIIFVGSYYNEYGQYREFVLPAYEIWINPLYEEGRLARAQYLNDNRRLPVERVGADTALIYTSVEFPVQINPAHILTVSYVDAQHRAARYSEDSPSYITVVGHSSDKPYLTVHQNAPIVSGAVNSFVSEADVVSGASGGPAFVALGEDGAPISFNQSGQALMIAVNSHIYVGGKRMYHAYFDPVSLEGVPFLRRSDMPRNEYCVQSGEVLASRLNIRVAPDVLAMALVPRGGQYPSPLTRGTLFNVVAMTTNHLDEAWALVETELGYTGYIRADDSYVSLHPRTCYIR